MLAQLFPNLELPSPLDQLLNELAQDFFLRLPDTTQLALSSAILARESPAAIMARSPVLHKLGQVLARDARVPAEIRVELQKLEVREPSEDYGELVNTVRKQARSPVTVGAPLAEGSLAVVFPLRCQGRELVAKVLKHKVAQRLDAELKALAAGGRLLKKRARRLGLPELDYSGTLLRVRQLLLAEANLEEERAQLFRARRLYAKRPALAIPEPLDWPGQALFMQRLFGGPLTEELAGVMLEELVVRPLLTGADESLLHGDLHHGNLMTTDDGRLGILDWGLAIRLDGDRRSALARLAAGTLVGNARVARYALEELGVYSCSNFSGGNLLQRLDALLDGAVGPLPGWLVLLRKTLHQAEGVARTLLPEVSLERVLWRHGAGQLLAESPFRLLLSPAARAPFGSGLSTLDLCALLY